MLRLFVLLDRSADRLIQRVVDERQLGVLHLGARREQRGQLESLHQKVELLDEESRAAQAHEGWHLPEASVRDEDIEVAFLKEKQRRAQS